jgi:long-chain acyl-CoA synthetase
MGGILSPLLVGSTVVLAKSFIISHILEMIKKHQITMLLAVPTLYRLIINYCRNISDMGSVHCFLTGGDVMSVEMQEEFRTKFKKEVLQGYGLTECLPVTCNSLHNNKVGSLGPPGRSDVKIKIVNDSGHELDPGAIGEIIINSPTVMRGYYGLDEISRTVLKEGWLYTGDFGYLDLDGYLYFTGRKKNVAKVGGKLVDLKQVREILLSHPFIEEASISFKEDPLWGHMVVAEITGTSSELTEAEIRAFFSKRLSQYKMPKIIRCPEKVKTS